MFQYAKYANALDSNYVRQQTDYWWASSAPRSTCFRSGKIVSDGEPPVKGESRKVITKKSVQESERGRE